PTVVCVSGWCSSHRPRRSDFSRPLSNCPHAGAQGWAACGDAARGLSSTSEPRSPLQALPPFQLNESGSPPSAADVQEVLPHLTPKQLADAVWCFAQHEIKPTAELMDAVAQEIHSKLAQFRAQDLSNTLWAFATLKYQPTEPWWQDFERQVYGALTDLTDRQLANLLWAFAVLERRPSPAAPGVQEGTSVGPCSTESRGWVLEPLLAHSCARGFSGYTAGSLHLLVWSLGKLDHAPPAVWLEGFLPVAEANFFRFTPTELTNIIWALAKLGADLPCPWMDKLLMVAQWRFPSFPARLLSIVAWSTATLNHRPQQEWQMCFEEQVRSKFLDFSGHELACVAWSLRRFGYSTKNNLVFYLLQKQQRFLDVDFDVLSSPKLLRQVLGLKASAQGEGLDGGHAAGGQ
ncbi:Tbc2 translation factor, chloroplastic, partial [Tetrabaena socialis]